LDVAEKIYVRILEADPAHPDALHFLGLAAYQAGKHETAADLMSKAISMAPLSPLYHSNFGLVLQALGDADSAINQFREAISLKPDFADAYYNLGNALHLQGKLHLAIVSYREAIRLIPQFSGCHYNLGNALKDLGKLEEAAASYIQALCIQPDFTQARLNLANTLHDLNRFEEAVAQIKTVLHPKSNISQLAAANYGQWLGDCGFHRESVFYYQQAFQERVGGQQTANPDLAPGLANAYFELTNKCNFHCDFCPSDSQKRSIGFMDKVLTKRLINEVAEKNLVPKVNLHLMGEPTLHPDLLEILVYASTKNVKTELVTNGSTLTAKNAPKILDALFGILAVSLQTPSKLSFKHRGEIGLGWDKYIGNIRKLIREHLQRIANLQSAHHTIELRVMVTRNSKLSASIIETDQDIQTVLNDWSQLVADIETELSLPVFQRHTEWPATTAAPTNPVNLRFPLQRGLTLTFWQGFSFANSMLSPEYQLEHQDTTTFCSRPFLDVAVLANGDVTLCCLDYDGQLAIGNIQENSLENLLSGQPALDLRAAMLDHHPLPAYCQQCQAKSVPRKIIPVIPLGSAY
jgi:tetratricopeptide (TPR) repeat protein